MRVPLTLKHHLRSYETIDQKFTDTVNPIVTRLADYAHILESKFPQQSRAKLLKSFISHTTQFLYQRGFNILLV